VKAAAMSENCYQLFFNGVLIDADLDSILSYLQKELNLSPGKLEYIVNSLPCALYTAATIQSAERVRISLTEMGCLVSSEQAVTYPHLAFAIPQRHERVIKKELSKAQRARTGLMLMYTRVERTTIKTGSRSLLEPVEDQIETFFRDSDTVLTIDESSMLVLCFATDQIGAEIIKNKAEQALSFLMGSDATIMIGYGLFPQEGETIEELLSTASTPRETGKSPLTERTCEPVSATASHNKLDTVPDTSCLQLCFNTAHGSAFKRLLELDAAILWSGLSRTPQETQKKFIARLPSDAPHTAELEKLMANRLDPLPWTGANDDQLYRANISRQDPDFALPDQTVLHQQVMAKLSCYEDLPTLPSVATQIYSIASDPHSSAAELADIIMKDPALTSKLLKIVNSAFYGCPQQINSVKQAVVLLGMDDIVGIAFGLAAAKVFDVTTTTSLVDPKQLWRHSVGTALIAQHLCSGIPGYRNQGAFTAGLLHDVGKIFLIENFPSEYCIASAGSDEILPPYEREEEVFGQNHAAIGKLLSAEWNLPEPLLQAITCHHQPLEAESDTEFVAIIGLADYLYHRTFPGNSAADAPWLTVGHRNCLPDTYRNPTPETLGKMIREITEMFNQSSDYLFDSH
jgi:HD-like signal output (HDOD) protein